MLKLLRGLVIRFEGMRLKAYRCPAGVWTIGAGHTGGVKPGDVVSEAQALDLADEDSLAAAVWALRLTPDLAASDARWAAIADFIFNLGATRYKASTLRRKIREGDWAEAEAQLHKWIWGGGRKLPGLVRRRAAEAELMRRG